MRDLRSRKTIFPSFQEVTYNQDAWDLKIYDKAEWTCLY